MKILRFNEAYNPTNEPKLIKTGMFVSNEGSGEYQLCGSLNKEEFQKAKELENGNYGTFKRFHFVVGKSIKEVDPYEDCDSIIWINTYGVLMSSKKNVPYTYETVYVSKFMNYYDLLDKYSDYKYEMLPYFVAEGYYGTSKPYVIDFFERLLENKPYGSEAKCWENEKLENVINYIKNCGVHNAYKKLTEILLSGPHGYKFAKYFDEVPKKDQDSSSGMIDRGFTD